MIWKLKEYKNNIAIIDEHGLQVSYGKLSDDSDKLCEFIRKGNGNETSRCLVFNLCDNVIGALFGYVSFLNHKIVPAMLSSEMEEQLLFDLYLIYEPAYVWCSLKDAERSIFSELPRTCEMYGYVLLKTPFNLKTELHTNLALLLTTSGSTGSPKFVRQSYANIRCNMNSIIEYLNIDSAERPITNLPMNYTYGLSIINTHLDVGATILLTSRTLIQREFWDFFKENKATSLAGVPYTYEILKKLRFFRMDLPYLKTLTQAGGKLLPKLHKEFAEYAKNQKKKFVVMYGACEATARMGWLPPEKSIEKAGSMGIAIPGGRFELIDESGNVISAFNEVGELVYYGENVTMGYSISGADLIKGDERNGRYETGDMAKMDRDGYFYIVGRKKRFLKIFGNRVNLDDCERMLKEKFDGTEIACGGVDDKLYIFATNGNKLSDMADFLSDKTGLNPVAFKVKVIKEIPHNESGKILYKELEKYYD